MAHARDKHRRGRDGRLKPDPALDLRRRVKGLFAKLGVLGLFERIPACFRERLYGCCYPDPVLAFDPSFPSGEPYEAVRDTVREQFAQAKIRLTTFDLTVRDYWTIVYPMVATLRRAWAELNTPLGPPPRSPPTMRPFLERALAMMEQLSRKQVDDEIYLALHDAVIVPLVAQSRLDARLLHGVLSYEQVSFKQRMIIRVYAEQAPTKLIRLRSGRASVVRPMHRVGSSNTWSGLEWASWTRESLKGHWPSVVGIGANESWPVYVQSHAIKRMRERLNVFAHADLAEHWMYQSLMEPKIVSTLPGEGLLVAFEVFGKRLGYLVVTAQDGFVAVRTFLFLTMAKTPEGRMLAKKLKLTREEADYLRLHELSRFTQTDLKDDPQLRQLLKECGCGQLFKLAEDEAALRPGCQAAPTPFAAELKQYVGLAA